MAGTGLLTGPYGGWAVFQQRLVGLAEGLSPEQLRLQSVPAMWSTGMLAAHLVATRAAWWHDRMGEGGAPIAEIARWDEEDRHLALTPADIVRGLQETWGLIEGTVPGWHEPQLDVAFPHPAHPDRPPRSRRWTVWHVLEHDLFHGGELSHALGIHGFPGIDL